MSRSEGVRLEGYSKVFTVDYQQPETLLEAWEATRPDFALHMASEVVTGRDFNRLEAEYQGTVLPALRFAATVPDTTKLSLFWGSCEEYGNASPPFVETQPQVCFSPYGWGKISAFHGALALAKQRKLRWSWLRPFLTFGPGQTNSLFIPTVIRGCLKNEKIRLTGCEQTRDFLFVDDLARMVLKILEEPAKAQSQVINLCEGRERKLRDVAESIQKIVGKGSLDFGALPYRSEEAFRFFGSPKHFQQLFGDVSYTEFHRALETTIASYVDKA